MIGCTLVRVLSGRRLSGTIVETEAYRGSRDPASHAFRGETARNAVMFGEAGHAYVYFTYGSSFCLNLTTEAGSAPGAVLIRGVQPLEGIGEMVRNRGVEDLERVADGPGKLTRAFLIDRSLNGEDLVKSQLLFVEGGVSSHRVRRSPRIGVTRGSERKWRFYLEGSRYISRNKGRRIAQNP